MTEERSRSVSFARRARTRVEHLADLAQQALGGERLLEERHARVEHAVVDDGIDDSARPQTAAAERVIVARQTRTDPSELS